MLSLTKKIRSFTLALSVVVGLSFIVRPNILCADHDRESAVVRAVRKVSPVVVNIST